MISQLPQGAEGFEDFGDLLGSSGGLFAEESGEGFGVGAVGGEEFLEGGDLGGDGFGPREFFGGGGGRGGSRGGEVDFFLFVGGGIGLGGALVVEGDEAGEEGLLEGLGIRTGGVEAVGEGDGAMRSVQP